MLMQQLLQCFNFGNITISNKRNAFSGITKVDVIFNSATEKIMTNQKAGNI